MNGESLLHLACRRSHVDTVMFLIHEAKVRVDGRDNIGRTVLHDACWRTIPDFALMSALLSAVSPHLLLAEDTRGHTPFEYTRKHHSTEWVEFLRANQELIRLRLTLPRSLLWIE